MKNSLASLKNKQIIVNSDVLETRIALLEGTRVVELFVERKNEGSLVGRIYKGIVSRVLPGMNSAFIDLGLNKAGFLYGGDAFNPDESFPYTGDYASLEDDIQEKIAIKKPIEKLLHEGQEILVQVTKDPLGTKGPRVTMFLTIPGRYLVLMPLIHDIGISRKIEDETEKERLKKIITSFEELHKGVILRTAAKDSNEDILKREFVFLNKVWTSIEVKSYNAKAPEILYQDLDITKKIIRDIYSEDVSKIIVDDLFLYHDLSHFLSEVMPQAQNNLEIYQDATPIFDIFGIELDIAKALSRKVSLPSGGYLIIDETEALTSFDVNTGKYVGKYNAEHTIVKTNIEAVKKVVEQIRIRNIGGIIIIDFIDMEDVKNQEKVFHAFQEELKLDRARTNILRINELGLIQMTRKRTSGSLEKKLLTDCLYCQGRGKIRSIETEALDLIREITRHSVLTQKKKIQVRLRSDLKEWMNHHEKDLREILSKRALEVEFQFEKNGLSALRLPAFEVLSD